MTSTTFVPGTVITSPWLNDVDTSTYTTVPNLQSKVAQTISVKDFGAASSASGATNLTAFKAAVAAVAAGGWLIIPFDTNPYTIDTSTGESSAITINKRMTVVFEGDVKSSTAGAVQADPQTIFLISGDNVSFIGTGKIIGNGTTDSTNSGTATTTPSLVKVTGSYFRMEGLTIDTPWKTGVFLYGSSNSIISSNKFTGGPTTYTDTGYFGIYLVNGANHIVSGNQFYPDGSGGMYVQCVFTSGTNSCVFENNLAIKPYEKIFYINSSDNLVVGNLCYGNSGTIPGTSFTGTMSDSIRVSGSRNTVKNNYLLYTSGITSTAGGTANVFSGNTLLNCGQGGISIYGGSAALDFTEVSNNVISCGNWVNAIIQDGIYISAPSGTNYYMRVSNNTIAGFSPVDPIANITAWAKTTVTPYRSIVKPTVDNGRYYQNIGSGTTGATEPTWPTTPGATVVDGSVTWTCYAYANNTTAQIRVVASSLFDSFCQISNNILSNGNIGIFTTYLDNSEISNNQVSATLYPIKESNGSYNQYRSNQMQMPVGAVKIDGLGATSNGDGNIYQKTSLSAVSTATAGVNTYTVSTALIVAATNAIVQVTPANAAAATFIAANGVYAVQSSPNVQVSSGNGTNFAGTEQFLIQLIQ